MMDNETSTLETRTMDRNEQPNNLNELMAKAAEALENRDAEMLEDLKQVSEGWLQDDESRDAQCCLLDAMINAAYLLED